jgi:hypothetical protein
MRKIVLLSAVVSATLAAMLPGTPAQAQLRTWVSSAGGGLTCTRAAPCNTFQLAHDANVSGGEINCVDAGDFTGTNLTISKSITIDCGGAFGGVLFRTVTVNGAGIVVRLRNLSVAGGGPGIGAAGGGTAINFINGAALYVENCVIDGWQVNAGQGIHFAPPDGVTAKLFVTDSVISNNGLAASGGGIAIAPAGSGSARVTIERTRVENNTYGIFAVGTGSSGVIIVHVKDSVVSNNVVDGIGAYTSAGHSTVSMTVDRSSSLLNGGNGILAQGSPAFIFLANSTVMSNTTGLNASGGTIVSYQDNHLTGNVTDGAPTAMLSVK